MRIKGKPFKLLLYKEHIRNLNQPLKAMNIKFVFTSSLLNKKFKNLFNNIVKLDLSMGLTFQKDDSDYIETERFLEGGVAFRLPE